MWFAIPGTDEQGGAATMIARLLCPGVVPLTMNILLLYGGIQTFRGVLFQVRRCWLVLRVEWVVAWLVLADGLIARPTPQWPVISGIAAVVFVVAFSIDFPLKRLIRDIVTVEEQLQQGAPSPEFQRWLGHGR